MTDTHRDDLANTELRRADLHSDPIQQLQVWYQEARDQVSPDWLDIDAVTLATASSTGEVSARVVLLKGIDQEGLRFFTNYDSRKSRQLNDNPRAAVCIYWPHLHRQVRVEGGVVRLDRASSEAYFHSRPRGSQISAAISPQSAPIESRDVLLQRADECQKRYADQPIPLPDNWGGFVLKGESFEFWQCRVNRLHDRFLYVRDGNAWRISRLAP